MADESEIKVEDFENAVDKTFTVSIGGDAPTEMTLLRTETFPAENTTRKEAPFSLIFSASPNCHFSSGLYQVESDETGAHDMYLSEIGNNEATKTFEAHYR